MVRNRYWLALAATLTVALAIQVEPLFRREPPPPRPVEPRLDFFTEPPEPMPSPARRVHEFLDGGGTAASAATQGLWRVPQTMLAYAQSFLHDPGTPLVLRYAGGILLEAEVLMGYSIHDALDDTLVRTTALEAARHPVVRQACHSFFRGGCAYSGRLDIDTGDLEPGVYYVVLLDDAGGRSMPVYFSARASATTPGRPETIVMFPTLTWQAYNLEGGGSLYYLLELVGDGYVPTLIDDELYSVSLNRPVYYDPSRPEENFDHSPGITLSFLRELRDAGVATVSVSDTDLHNHPDLLDHAERLVLTGHPEYWTKPLRQAVDQFVRGGGCVANMSGNNAFWRVNMVGREIFVDKRADPFKGTVWVPPAFAATGRFDAPWIDHGPEQTFGGNYRYAGVLVRDNLRPEQAALYGMSSEQYGRSGEIVVRLPDHPLFVGTGLRKGSRWGAATSAVAVELDGVPLGADGEILAALRHRFPKDLHVLAQATLWNGSNVDGLRGINQAGVVLETRPFAGGGTVLGVGSIGFGTALHHGDRIAARMLRNTLSYLKAPRCSAR